MKLSAQPIFKLVNTHTVSGAYWEHIVSGFQMSDQNDQRTKVYIMPPNQRLKSEGTPPSGCLLMEKPRPEPVPETGNEGGRASQRSLSFTHDPSSSCLK